MTAFYYTNFSSVTLDKSNVKILLTFAVASIKSIIAFSEGQTFPLHSLCVTAGDGCDGYLDTATAIIKTVTAVTNCHGAEPKCSSILRPSWVRLLL